MSQDWLSFTDISTKKFFYGIITHIPVLSCFLLSITIVFPVYIKVYSRNKAEYEATPIFPVIEHFHSMILLLQYLFTLIITCGVLYMIEEEIFSFFLWLGLVTTGLTYVIILTFSSCQHILLSVFAIQQFVSKFFPEWGKIGRGNWKKFKKTLWIILFLFHALFLYIKMLVDRGELDKHRSFNMLDDMSTKIYITAMILFFFCTSLYFYLYLYLKKSTADGADKYILYQTMVLLASKILYIPSIVFFRYYFQLWNEDLVFCAMIFVDLFTTHFFVQFSYLLCNRDKVASVIFCCRGRQVDPQNEVIA